MIKTKLFQYCALDALLASNAYGEKWASHGWTSPDILNAKGYSKGMVTEISGGTGDWLIRAFNEDKPYDRFIPELKLAGETCSKIHQKTNTSPRLFTEIL
ncbi:MAG: DUF1549 domain-containing protein [Saprospiraceae bacterium]|nr:DUF1549 domain-containing protein [Saprospiraceae bacterium]